MNPPIRIRLLTHADLPFVDSLRRLAGWNQTTDDWKRFLATEPAGCFLAEWEGQSAGTATTTVYGPTLAWIGMVLVHPDYRRRGIGRALLVHCLDHLQHRGIQCVKLDATPLGEKVYRTLGFQAEWAFARWSGQASDPVAKRPDPGMQPWASAGLEQIEALDSAAFGVSRLRFLKALATQSAAAFILNSPPDRLAGFGLLRPGALAHYLGPVVAASESAGLRLVEALISRCKVGDIFWDIPDANVAAVSWAERKGFTVQRRLTRMYRGRNPNPGRPGQVFALSGPETG